MHPYDPDEIRPTPAHLRLLAYTRPRPGFALQSACEATGLAPPEIAIWVGDVRGQLGRYIWSCLMHDDELLNRFIAIAAKVALPPCMTVATPLHEALDVMRELLPDLVMPALQRPTGTVVIVIADEHDDTRLAFVEPERLVVEQ